MNNKVFQSSVFEWPYPWLVSHRCGGSLAPENTLAGFDVCARHDCRMVEFDAKLSADEQVFLLHDDMLDRTTNGHGAADEWTWDELVKLDAGAWYAPDFAGTRLPTLEEVSRHCLQAGVLANIEIKPGPGREARTGQLVARAAADLWQHGGRPLLSSFSVEALAAARVEVEDLPRGVLFEALPQDWLAIARELDCVSVHVDHEYLNAEQVTEIRSQGLRVLAYTVNEPGRASELIQWGVDAICTDRIDLLAK